MPSALVPVYFTDENALGLGKLLERGDRTDVLYPPPATARGAARHADLEWMPEVARRELVVLTRDRLIRTRPAELRVYLEHGPRSVWLSAKQDLGPPRPDGPLPQA